MALFKKKNCNINLQLLKNYVLILKNVQIEKDPILKHLKIILNRCSNFFCNFKAKLKF